MPPAMTPLPCPPELWPEFSRLLDQALDRPEAERGAWLQALPAEHAALRPHLARVLHEQTVPRDARFLQAPRLAPDHAAPAPRQPGDRVGPTPWSANWGVAAWARYGWPAVTTAPTNARWR